MTGPANVTSKGFASVGCCTDAKVDYKKETRLQRGSSDVVRSSMPPKRKPQRSRRARTPKRQRRMTYGQVGGVSPGLTVGIGKAGYGITKAFGEHQTKRAIKIAGKRRREVEHGKRKRYAGESLNCSM